MAISTYERAAREVTYGASPACRQFWMVTGAETEVEAYDAVVVASSSFFPLYGGLLQLPRRQISPKELGAQVWSVDVSYQFDGGSNNPVVPEIEFQLGGKTAKITKSLATRKTGVNPSTGWSAPPANNNLIGLDEEGKAEGADIPTSSHEFTETHSFPVATLTTAFRRTLATYIGKSNSADFRGFKRGEVVLASITGRARKGEQNCALSFHYVVEPNQASISSDETGGVPITGTDVDPAKRGHEVLWLLYETSVDAPTKKLTKKPVAAYVETVLYETDFNVLGLADPLS